MKLKFFEFDGSEDMQGNVTFDAMASVYEARWPDLRAELQHVLMWATQNWGNRLPLDDGGAWDCCIEAVREVAQPMAVDFDVGRGLLIGPAGVALVRYSLSLTLCGVPGFAASLREHFELDA